MPVNKDHHQGILAAIIAFQDAPDECLTGSIEAAISAYKRAMANDGSTHSEMRHLWGPKYYDCALARIKDLESEIVRLRKVIQGAVSHGG